MTYLRFAAPLLLIVVLLGCSSSESPQPMLASSQPGQKDPCEGKERCLTVYVAPWCPHCNRSVPLLQAMHQKLKHQPRVGMRVIVGRDNLSELEGFSRKLMFAPLYDKTGEFYKGLGEPGIPIWILTDMEGVLLRQITGAPSGAPVPVIRDHLINEVFHLRPFMHG